jgi:hypothetical protein
MPTDDMILESKGRLLKSSNSIDMSIPSPFLFHDWYNQHTGAVEDCTSGWDLPYFKYACSQTQPELDFQSYRPVKAFEMTGPPVQRDRRDSLGFALQPASESRHKLESNHVSDTSHDSSTHGCPLPLEDLSSHNTEFVADDSSHVLDNAILRLEPTGTVVDPESSWTQTRSTPTDSLEGDRDILQIFQANQDSTRSSSIEIPFRVKNVSTATTIINTVAPYAANPAATC